jgi:hypothetical protein
MSQPGTDMVVPRGHPQMPDDGEPHRRDLCGLVKGREQRQSHPPPVTPEPDRS